MSYIDLGHAWQAGMIGLLLWAISPAPRQPEPIQLFTVDHGQLVLA